MITRTVTDEDTRVRWSSLQTTQNLADRTSPSPYNRSIRQLRFEDLGILKAALAEKSDGKVGDGFRWRFFIYRTWAAVRCGRKTSSASEISVEHAGVRKNSSRTVRSTKAGVLEIRKTKVCATEVRTGHLRFVKICPHKTGVNEPCAR